MTAAGQKRQHCGCVETQILCSLASVQRVWLQVVCNLGQKKIRWLVKQSLCSSLAQNQRRNLHCPWYLYWISTLKTGSVIHICLQD